MTEKQLQLLGFKREDSSDTITSTDTETGETTTDSSFYYYTYDVVIGFGFISCASDEVDETGQWYVELFDTHPNIHFTEFGEVQALINLLTSRIV